MLIDVHDVVIAGGGYGGQIAARELIRSGFRVLMVDRRPRPGWPPQSTSGLSRAWIDKYQLPVQGRTTPITSFHMYGPQGQEADLGGGILGEVGDVLVEPDLLARMERDSTDRGLEVVRPATVFHVHQLHRGFDVEILMGDQTRRHILTDYIIDATGFLAWVGRQLNMIRDLHPEDAHGGVEITIPRPSCHPPGEVRMWLGHNVAPWGYAWAFPATEDGVPHVRVGLGTPRAVGRSAGQWFGDFRSAHPEYSGAIHHRVGGIIPTAPVARTLERNGALLIGDAARVCCPITGGGIVGALETGYSAAHAISDGAPESYPQRIKWLTDELSMRWKVKQILYGLTDRELGRLVEFMNKVELPTNGGIVNPFVERRRVTWALLRREPRIAASILTRGRFWTAIHPRTHRQ